MSSHRIASSSDDASSSLQIYNQIHGMIISGQLGAGERLPTVRQLAGDLGVAPRTAAKAYKMLETDGLVVTRTAAGTRVSESAAVLPIALVTRIRGLVAMSKEVGASQDDVVNAIRANWRPYASD
jgi:GntR family transcriptional regulator